MNLLKPNNKKEKQNQQLLIVLLLCGLGYYFFVYLPDQDRQQLEMQIQTDINTLQNIQSNDYSNMLTKLQGYLKWKDGTATQQEALENQKENLNQAINWLIQAEKHLADENQQARTQEEEEKKKRELEMIKKKKLHWRRNKQKRSWTEDWIARKKDSFENVLRRLGGEENINIFDVAADIIFTFLLTYGIN